MGQGFVAREVEPHVPESYDHLRHKHFVVVPLVAALLLLLQFSYYMTAPRSSLVDDVTVSHSTATQNDQAVALSHGAAAKVFAASSLESKNSQPVLARGSALFSTKGSLRVTAGALHIRSIAGSFHLTNQEGMLTVAAISAPVLIADSEGYSLLVPVGYQWRGKDLLELSKGEANIQPLPSDFLHEMQATARTLVSTDEVPLPRVQPFFHGIFLLPGAKARQDAADKDFAKNELIYALTLNAPERAQQILVEMDQEHLADPSLLSDVLSYAPNTNLQTISKLLEHSSDAELTLLMAAHPNFTEVAAPKLSDNQLRTWLTSAFLSEDGALALVPAVQDTASHAMEVVLGGMNDTEKPAFLSSFVIRMAGIATKANAKMLPERARGVSALTESLIQGNEALLTPDAAAALFAMTHLDRPELGAQLLQPVVPVQNVSSASSESSEAFGTADSVIAATEQMLREMHVMRSTQTTVEAIAPHTARVSGIFAATSTGDKELGFLYDTEKKELREIAMDGVLQPFPMSLAAFAAWIK